MNFNQFERRASCHPHHLLLAVSNKSTLIIAGIVYIGWKSAVQGPLFALFLSCEVCICGAHTTQTLCRISHSLVRTFSPGHARPPAAEPGSGRSEGIIRESVYVCVVPPFHAMYSHISEHLFHMTTC